MIESRAFLVEGASYQIRSDGLVWSQRSRRLLTPDIDKDGYHVYRLGKSGEAFKAHILVLTYFDRQPFPGEQGRHLDGDPGNNRKGNLEWGTGKQNWDDKRRHGRATVRTRHGRAKLTDAAVLTIRSAQPSYGYAKALAEQFGVHPSRIHQLRRGEGWDIR